MPIAAFHTTSLASDPVTAHIASAQLTLIELGLDGAAPTVETLDWVLDPRWDNAPDMDAVRRLVAEEGPSMVPSYTSDEYVEGLRDISEALSCAWETGFILVTFDAAAHLTIVENEFNRVFVPEQWSLGGPVLDPLVLDRAGDKYRKGPRALADVCRHYGVEYSPHPDPRDVGAALAAARLAYVMLRRYSIEPISALPEGRSLRSLVESKDDPLVSCSPGFLTRCQSAWARSQREDYRSFLEAQAGSATSDAARERLRGRVKNLRTGWPTLGGHLPELPRTHAKYHHHHPF
ncbi:hypothetical protein [Rhodococcus sp. W8901]|uniref:hypothetical protein n=1 Tax=Rhodococcus sp. W8901 TaxID=2742603 RepID=UPI0015816123|nr:hypothetical protein [Rhodococcus sp. W8901]QKT12154.1 hypothetical protein HUN07_16860 [Rhodococcus sp. W8901]